MPRLAVLGHPVAHSRSPAMHGAALAELGLAGEWSYEAIDIAPEGFEARVLAMPREGFAGANVTVPHKLAALRLADHPTGAALEIGAANTLVFREDGIEAENTDAAGLLAALPVDPRGARAVVLGAGGSARAVVWALVTHGSDVHIWNRTPEKAEALADELGGSAVGTSGERRVASGDYDLLINCTTVGMGTGGPGLDSLPLDPSSLTSAHSVVDLAYGADETELVRAARAAGASAVGGLEVLVRQGAASLRIWTGLDPPVDVMRRAALA